VAKVVDDGKEQGGYVGKCMVERADIGFRK
jgi:hypothetical protein